MAKRPVPLYDFKAFGAAIKAARNEYGESRKKVSDELYISPRYLANIENKGQQPSLQVFYDLVTRYHISVDQFFFPNSNAEKSTGRRQLDALLDGMSDKGIRIVTATAKEIAEVEKAVDYPLLYGKYRIAAHGGCNLFLRPKSRECATNTAFRWGYGVDSKHSKRVPVCGKCLLG